MIELKKETERVILVGVCLPGQEDIDASLEEQDILYTAVDKYGNTGYAKMTVKIVGNENESLS